MTDTERERFPRNRHYHHRIEDAAQKAEDVVLAGDSAGEMYRGMYREAIAARIVVSIAPPLREIVSVLRESAKQHRAAGDPAHGEICDSAARTLQELLS